MKKPITRKLHGLIDYSYAAIVPLLPELAGFNHNDDAKNLCRTVGGGALLYTALTKAEWGAVKVLPFKAHLLIDLSVSLFNISAPWVMGFNKNKAARNTFVAIGLIGTLASLATEAREMS
jgi:hypothetical protein